MRMNKLALLMLAAAMAPAAAEAAVLTHVRTVSLSDIWSGGIGETTRVEEEYFLPQWRPSDGVLTRATVTADLRQSGTLSFCNAHDVPLIIGNTQPGHNVLDLGFDLLQEFNLLPLSVSAASGECDSDAASVDIDLTRSYDATSAAFIEFIGTGDIALLLRLEDPNWWDAEGGHSIDYRWALSGTLSIAYDYTAVPAPGAVGLVGLGALALGLVRRRAAPATGR